MTEVQASRSAPVADAGWDEPWWASSTARHPATSQPKRAQTSADHPLTELDQVSTATAASDADREDRIGWDPAGDTVSAVREADGARSVLTSRALRLCEKSTAGPHRGLQLAVVVIVIGVLVAEGFAIAPHVRGAGAALTHPSWGWLIVAVLAEIGSMISFARVQRRMLAAGGMRLALRRAIAVTFAANAMSVTLPAGPVLSTGYTFRRMRAWGASSPVITWGMLTSGVLSTIALTVIAAFGASLAGGDASVLLIGIEIVAVLAVAWGLRRLARRPDLLLRIGTWSLRRVNRAVRRPALAGQDRVRELLDELLMIHPTGRDWLTGLYFAAMNWLLDLLCLVAACRAVGAHGPTIAVAMVAYAGGMAASSLPLIPGGIGVVDGALLIALTHGGLSLASATAGVVMYRLISFVLVAAIGWVFWFLLSRKPTSRTSRCL
ncbi:lysylphosphatidylglycerol synthase transmembrane domain-containing protein [Jatrophihabitans sp. DSM 45814]